jgi:NDP-sugar pyrophosphorylase family protein
MRSIILAAGFGTRLLPLTGIFPKALVPIVNIPIINLQIEYLKRAGVDEAGINIHHHRDLMLSHLSTLDLGVKITTKTEDVILDTGGGLSNFREFIGSEPDFIVYNCDILTSADPLKMLEIHRKNNSIATLVLLDNGDRSSILVGKDGTVLDIADRLGVNPANGSRYLYGAGIFIYKNEIFKHLPPADEPFPLIPQLMKLMQKNPGSVKSCILEELTGNEEEKPYWRDIGSIRSYLDIHSDILTDGKFTPPGFTKPNNGILIGENCIIGDDVIMDGFVSTGRDSKIGSGAKITDSVIIAGATIPDNAEINKSIVYFDQIIKE